MKLTINQLRVELADLIQANAQVNSFFWGDFARAETEAEQQYPLVYAYTTSGIQINKNTDVIPLVIGVCDKLFKDWVNLNDVESDTLQISRGIFNAINTSPKWQKIGSIQSCTANKFIDKGKDEVAGYMLTISFKLRDTSSYCDEPFFGYDWNGSLQGSCLPVQIFKNGVLIETIPAGGLYSYAEEPCQDANVTINGNEFGTVGSGEAVDIPVVNSGSNPVGAIDNGHVVIGNSVVNINGIQVGDVLAEDTLSIGVELDGFPSGSWNATGQVWEVQSQQLPIDVSINGITVADDVVSDVALTLVDQNGDDVPFTQTGTELEVEVGGDTLFDLEINVDGVLKQTIPLDSQENNVINVNLYS